MSELDLSRKVRKENLGVLEVHLRSLIADTCKSPLNLLLLVRAELILASVKQRRTRVHFLTAATVLEIDTP